MITSLGTPWSSADITSNGTFVQILTGTEFPKTYIVSNCIATNSFQILRTIDGGQTFIEVANGPAGPSFDPIVCMKGGILYFIGAIPNADPTKTDLAMFSYNTVGDNPGTPSVLTPSILVTGTRIHSGYDLVCLATGDFIVVTSVTQPTTPVISNAYALIAIHVSALFTITTTDVIVTASSIRTGEAYGGISLILNGTLVELFYTAHQKKMTFGAIRQEIRCRTYQTTNPIPIWSNETVIQSYSSYYTDDKLTVASLTGALAGNLVLTSLFYVQEKSKLYSVMQVGSRVSGVWKWTSYRGTTNWSFMEPTLTISENNDVYLMYTEGDVNSGSDGVLRVSLLDTTTLQRVQQVGNWSKFNFKWLRGSKTPVAASDLWVVIGEHTKRGINNAVIGYTPYYVSHLNLPPNVSLTPISATIQRGTLLHLSAAGTNDPDYDTLSFVWSTNDLTGNVHLIPVPGAPSGVDVLVDKSIGPNLYNFNVTVSVQDIDAYNTPIHAAVTATAALSVPANLAPTVVWTPSPSMVVTRNSIIVLEPTVTDAEADNLTYLWEQISGPILTILSPIDIPYLVIRTHGVDVYGASVQFTLTVSDGINNPVVSTVTLTIPSINFANVDQKFLSRAIFTVNGSPILERNNVDGLSQWTPVVVGGVSSDFFRSKYTRHFNGHPRQLYISQRTCSVLGAESPSAYYYRKVFLPNNDWGVIVDAILTETDDIIVLTDDYKLLRYSSTDIGTMNMRDDYQGITDLKSYMRGGEVKWFTVAPLVGGSRVLAFITNQGVLLVQIRESDFKAQAVLFLSMFDLSLYGGNDVLFVRFKGVEHLRKGQVLIGTKAPKEALLSSGTRVDVSGFEYFETIFDLNNHIIVDVWDRTNRINERVFTGEFLTVEGAGYSGQLQAPILHISAIDALMAKLTWDMIRPDLVKQYTMYYEKTQGIPGSSVRVPPTVNGFKSFPTIVNYGEPVTLKWDVENVNEIKIDGTAHPLNISQTTIIPKVTGSHILVARNAWGITEKLAPITVLPHAPTIKSFTTPQPTVVLGTAAHLLWDVVGADTLYIDQGVGNVTGRTSKSVYLAHTTTYQLFAINSFGTTTASVTVTV